MALDQEQVDQEIGAGWRQLLEAVRSRGYDLDSLVFRHVDGKEHTVSMSFADIQKPSGLKTLLAAMAAASPKGDSK